VPPGIHVLVAIASCARFLVTFRVFAGRGSYFAAAGDDALLADMPFMLPILAFLQRD
jgi:hypothetical protein